MNTGKADAPLSERRQAEAAQQQEHREGVRRRHFALAEERQLIERLHFQNALAEGETLRAIVQG